jgi:hypothetical protein
MCKGISVIVALGVVGLASPARAQTPSPAGAGQVFVSVSGSGQMQTRTFSNGAAFSSFAETGRLDSNQNVGRAGVVDVTGGFQFSKHLSVAAGLWMASSNSAAAATVSIPDPLFFGRFKTVALDSSQAPRPLKQTSAGVNIQFMWALAVGARTDLSLFVGPSVVRVRQDVATVAVTPNSQTATMSIDTQSASTSRAGNAGIDLTYRFAPHYGVGMFVRYAGGEVNLPAVPKLKVGGVQVGAGLRMRF